MSNSVGLVGLGNMGEPFARHLLDAGIDLHIYDIRPAVVDEWVARGAKASPSPRAMADVVGTILLSLPVPKVVEEVAEEISGGAGVHYVIDLSTTGPSVARDVAAMLRGKGISYIDAPVSGGVAGAHAASLTIMLACSSEDRSAIQPLLERLGRVFPVGSEAGQGQIVKILNNLLSAGSLLLAGEVAALGVKTGLDADAMINVFNAGSGRSSATLDKYPKAILPGTFKLGFTNALMFKDVSLCIEMAAMLNVEMPTARAVRDEWAAAMAHAGPEADFSTIVTKAEKLAGVEVRSANLFRKEEA